MLALYKNIKKLREQKGMSQETLAKLTGYSDRSSITKIEKGLVDLQQSKIELFATALGTTARELVGWDTDTPKLPQIMEYFNILNDIGKHEATKRVKELTYLPQYSIKTILPDAAHERTDISITDEMRKHDDDIMNEDNF